MSQAVTYQYTSTEQLEQMSAGNTEFVVKMIKIFVESMPEAMQEMKHHLDSQEWELLSGVAHKNKPSVAMLCHEDLLNIIKEIEAIGRSQDGVEKLADLYTRCNDLCELVLKELNQRLVELEG